MTLEASRGSLSSGGVRIDGKNIAPAYGESGEAHGQSTPGVSAVESFPKCDIRSFSMLDIRSDRIHYRLYRQDGTFQHMDCADTISDKEEETLWQALGKAFGAHDGWSLEKRGEDGIWTLILRAPEDKALPPEIAITARRVFLNTLGTLGLLKQIHDK